MHVCIATQPGGSSPNEDWVAATPVFSIVLDGLSTAGLATGCRHGVPWYVANLGGKLVASLANPDHSLTESLAEALEQVAGMHPECDLKNPGTPSSTVAVLRQQDDVLDYLVLADSPIVFENESGYSVVTDLRVESVLPELKAETEKYQTGTPEHKASVERLVTAQRQIRNTTEGYWIASSSPEAALHALSGSVHSGTVQSVAVMSDGVSRLVLDYRMATWAGVFERLRAAGPRGLIDTVREVEATDPTGLRWPRYKSGDDAAVAYCQM